MVHRLIRLVLVRRGLSQRTYPGVDVWRVERCDRQTLFLRVDDDTVLDAPVLSIREDLSSADKEQFI